MSSKTHLLKFDAIDSTNAYLRRLAAKRLLEDFTVVMAEVQTKGRGQMGTDWQSEHGKNLTVSVFKNDLSLLVTHQFYVSMITALSVYDTLKAFQIPKLRIKWPNDILSGNKKLAGILIENVIKNDKIQSSIIGFGINVNQKYFDQLPSASSMVLTTGVVFDRDEVLSKINERLQCNFALLQSQNLKLIKSKYESLLFRKDKPSTFITKKKNTFSGIIKGVTEEGKLMVWTEDNHLKTFYLKEIALCY